MSYTTRLYVLLGIITCIYPYYTCTREYIATFESDITVNHDSSMQAIETIHYRNVNEHNKHGIFRSFPIRYSGPYNTNYTITFTVTSVTRNGNAEPYHIDYDDAYAYVYIGDPETTLPPGNYTYMITYHTRRQIGFFDTHDELYWNIIGTQNTLAIHTLSARIHLPTNIPQKSIHAEAYYGTPHSKKHLQPTNTDNTVYINIPKTLPPGHAVTTSISWPKGYVKEPTWWEEAWNTITDNIGLMCALFSLLIVCICYGVSYIQKRRRESYDPIIPRFYPPADISPSGAHYMVNRSHNATNVAAEIVDLAVRGAIHIQYTGSLLKASYTITKQSDKKPQKDTLNHTLYTILFTNRDTVILNTANQKTILKAHKYLRNYLRKHYDT